MKLNKQTGAPHKLLSWLGRALKLALVFAWLMVAQLTTPALVQAQSSSSTSFEHSSTGFMLDMRHQTARCESCHIKGQFKGTPRDCAACHGWNNPRSSKVKSSKHMQTRLACDSCHSAFLARFEDAKFSHVNVQANTCQTCHAGSNPKIKTNPADALHKSALGSGMSCGACHSTLSFSKSGVASNHIPIASSARCEDCHNPLDFTQMPSIAAIHANAPSSSTNCAQCHSAANAATFSTAHMVPPVARPPANHIPMGSQGCESCHVGGNSSTTLPVVDGASFANAAFNHAGITSGCATCHGNNVTNGTFYGVVPKTPLGLNPAHVPTTLACEVCHVGSVPSGLVPVSGATGGQTTFAGGQFSHSGITSGCETCHGGTVSTTAFYGIALKTTAGLNPPHIPTTAACTTCHTGSIPSSLVPATGATSGTTFAGTPFSHSGITSGCATCHGPSVTNQSFYGVSSIVVMPPSSTAAATSHLPTSTTCENCHAGSTPSSPMSVTTPRSVPNSGFKLPAPTSSMIHGGTSSGCNTCHDVASSAAWMGMGQYPLTVTGSGASAQYRGFNVRPAAGSATFQANDAAHPASGDCSQCHGNTNYFSGPTPPANHIPYSNAASCSNCHSPFGTAPTVGNIHNWIQSKNTNCAQCHSTANAAQYASSTPLNPIVAPPSNHIAMGSLGCENCHMAPGSSITGTQVVDGDKFANAAFSHSGISSGCSSCHGSGVGNGTFFGVNPKSIDSLTPTHVPTTAECTTCHTNSIPSMLIAPSGATGGQTTFANAQFSHSGITTGCATCHGPNLGGSSFYGITRLTVMPPTSPAAATSHLPTSTTCENCHAGSKPSGLVAANASTSVPGTGFATPAPTASMIHTGVSGSCNTCHDVPSGSAWVGMGQYPISASGSGATAQYKGFQVRPASGAATYRVNDAAHPSTGDCSQCHGSFSYFGSPSAPANHIPYKSTAQCGDCHNPFGTSPTIGAIHSNIQSTNSNCQQCHSVANAALYASTTTDRPIVTPGSVGNHIPMGSLGCESCHMGANSSITGATVANGNTFANSAFSHSGISSGCASCHGSSVTSGTFYGVTPRTINGLNPAHVPTTAACESCHINSVPYMLIGPSGATGGQTTFANAQFSHSGITSGCATCHGSNVGNNSFYGITSIIVVPQSSIPGTGAHIPTSASCETCHSGSTPVAPVAANATRTVPGTGFQLPVPTASMIHTGVSGNCASCHDTNFVWVGMSKYPITTSAPYTGFQTRPQASAGTFFVADASHPPGECSNCHSSFSNFNGPSVPANHIPYSATATCSACHGDFSAAPTVAKIHANLQSTSTNCAQCHSAANAARYNPGILHNPIVTVPAAHIPMGSAGCESCHVGPNSSMASTPVPDGARFSGSLFNHTGATAACATCHGASVTPSTFTGVYPQTITAVSPAHVPTAAACDLCHVNSVPTGLVPAAGMTTFANGQFSHSGIATGCANCHGSGVTNSSFKGITNIVVLSNYNQSAGASSHIPAPNNAACEACHLGSVPSGLVAANASGGATSGFASPAPNSAKIHSAVTGSCNSCHDTGMSWLGVTSARYPMVPSVKTANASYTGFHTRPTNGVSTYAINDAGHAVGALATADCSQCHSGFTSFGAPTAPAGHIPYATNASCGSCHTNYPNAPSDKAAIHANIQSTTTNCAQCHSSANAALYAATTTTYGIKTPAANHIPMGALGCESCHVAANTTNFTSFANGAFSHSGITSGCNTCHGINVSSSTFDGLNQIVATGTLATPHVPVSNSIGCEVCHTNSVPSTLVPASGYAGTPNFSGAKFTHSGITSGCATCHGPASTGSAYAGLPVNSIVRMPATAPQGSSAHLPTSQTCENCHLASTPATLIAGVNTTLPPNSGFRLPAPSASMIHSGVTSGCSSCHEKDYRWMGMDRYPITSTSPFTGFQTRPYGTATTFSVLDGAHPVAGDCALCHSVSTFDTSVAPANHIPYKAGVACATCHAGGFGTAPAVGVVHANIQSSTTNCVQCHSTANAALYASTTTLRPLKTPASVPSAVHIDMGTLGCESCHMGTGTGIPAAVGDASTFGGAKFSHNSMTASCATCHGSGVSNSSFYGVTQITVLANYNASSGSSSHIPASNNASCETCHAAAKPAGLVSVTGPLGNGFRTPAPTSAMVHSGVSGNCSTCHEKDAVWLGMTQYPITSTAPFKGFQTRPYGSATTYSVLDTGHPASGDCSTCHTGYTEWATNVKPANHIPTANVACTACHTTTNFSTVPARSLTHANAPSSTTNCVQCHSTANAALYTAGGITIKSPGNTHIPMGTLSCEACHVGSNSSIATTVQNNSTFANSAFSHAGVTNGCASCHNGQTFEGSLTPVSMTGSAAVNPSAPHVPNPANADCGVCHQTVPTGLSKLGNTSATFATNSKYSHSGISSGCASCHGNGISGTSFKGIAQIVVLSNYNATSGTSSHIPAPNNASCEACHLANTPSGLIAPSATAGAVAWNGASGFYSPAPTGTQIHASISSVTCASCHEVNLTWTGLAKYPRTPSILTSGASYTGFHGRPVAGGAVNSIADGNHPNATSGDCSKCHGSTTSFSVTSMPANHIPIGSNASCTACHTNISASNKDFSVRPTNAAIHQYGPATTTTDCGQCHSASNAAKYAIPSASFTIVAPANNHVPYGSTNCSVCHTAAATVTSYTSFANALYSHSGVTSGCATCHGSGVTSSSFQGITSIVVMSNYNQAAGANSHIPAPNNGTCEACHAGNTPSGPIAANATSAAANTNWSGNSGFYSPAPTGVQVHSGTPTNCVACHETGMNWAGMGVKYPRSPSVVTLNASYTGFHTRPNATGTGFSILDPGHPSSGDCDLCHIGTASFTGVGKPNGHMPTAPTGITSCVTCHPTAGDYRTSTLAAPTSVLHGTISSAFVKYTAATVGNKTCTTCHAVGTGGTSGTAPFVECTAASQAGCTQPLGQTYQPKTVANVPTRTHLPIKTLDCNGCHASSLTSFKGVNMKSGGNAASMHTNATLAGLKCLDCHENGMATMWDTGGITLLTRIPKKHTSASRQAPNDCSNCHSFNGGFRAEVRPVMRQALVSSEAGRFKPGLGNTPTLATRGGMGNSFDHKGVEIGKCKSCHDGKLASGMPARHLMVLTSCDSCHRTTAWKPAQFSHSGVSPNTCLACHNGLGGSAKPTGHFMTARSCDSCHKVNAWQPVTYTHLSAAYRPGGDPANCVSCHVTNGEVIPRQMRALTRVKPVVGP